MFLASKSAVRQKYDSSTEKIHPESKAKKEEAGQSASSFFVVIAARSVSTLVWS